MSTLAKRVITASILIPVVISAILFLATEYLAVGIAIIALLAGLEWATLSGITNTLAKAVFALVLSGCMAGTYLLLSYTWFADWLFVVASVWWFAVAISLFSYKRIEKVASGVGIGRLLVCFIAIIPLWAAFVLIHRHSEDGPFLLLFLLVLIWIADSGAYFAGSRWGKRKLAPAISPGKSWEGVYGALVGALLCGVLMAWYYQGSAGALWLIPVCIVTVIMSVVGDLFESVLKRKMGMKDSGNLLPGHGGVLDRIDSLTAAAPVFMLGLQLSIGF